MKKLSIAILFITTIVLFFYTLKLTKRVKQTDKLFELVINDKDIINESFKVYSTDENQIIESLKEHNIDYHSRIMFWVKYHRYYDVLLKCKDEILRNNGYSYSNVRFESRVKSFQKHDYFKDIDTYGDRMKSKTELINDLYSAYVDYMENLYLMDCENIIDSMEVYRSKEYLDFKEDCRILNPKRTKYY
jgi:hypothetical protein